jgi:hypothetical protein
VPKKKAALVGTKLKTGAACGRGENRYDLFIMTGPGRSPRVSGE